MSRFAISSPKARPIYAFSVWFRITFFFFLKVCFKKISNCTKLHHTHPYFLFKQIGNINCISKRVLRNGDKRKKKNLIFVEEPGDHSQVTLSIILMVFNIVLLISTVYPESCYLLKLIELEYILENCLQFQPSQSRIWNFL